MAYVIKAWVNHFDPIARRNTVKAHVTINCADASSFVQMREQLPVVADCTTDANEFVHVHGVRIPINGLHAFAREAERFAEQLRQAEDDASPAIKRALKINGHRRVDEDGCLVAD